MSQIFQLNVQTVEPFQTTDATPTTIPDTVFGTDPGEVILMDFHIIVRRPSDGAVKMWAGVGCVKRVGLIVTVEKIDIGSSPLGSVADLQALAGATIAFAVDANQNGGLRVTGIVGSTLNWFARFVGDVMVDPLGAAVKG